MKITMKIFLTLLFFVMTIAHNFSIQNPKITITSTHQGGDSIKRFKRTTQNLRIHRHYDSSFTDVPANEELRVKIVEPAIRFWEEALLVKNPLTKPILFDRECSSYYHTSLAESRIKVCTVKCETNQACLNTVVPEKFLKKCYIRDDDSYNTIGEDGVGASNADLVVIITYLPESCGNYTLAYATSCYMDDFDNRPVLGTINICPGKLSMGTNLHTSITTLKHEIVHLLGLSPTIFSFFRDDSGNPLTKRDYLGWPDLGTRIEGNLRFLRWSNKTIVEKNITVSYPTGVETKKIFVMITPKVKKEIRDHFNCSTLEGLYLEDTGSIHNILSHFEKRIFQNELMTPTISVRSLVSRITMAFLEDTGWYQPDYSKAENYNFAKNIGCDFITQSCYEYMNSKIARNQSIYPYCHLDIYKDGITCSADGRIVEQCNIVNASMIDVPMKYRYFKDLNEVSPDKFSDYCPFKTEFLQIDDKNVINNGICSDTNNNAMKNTKYNHFNEGFGSNSTCLKFDKSHKWAIRSCGRTSYPEISGAGCYTYQCSMQYRLMIEVNGFFYQCLREGQIIDVTSGTKYLISIGKLICPACSSLCNETVCNAQYSIFHTSCNNVNRPCSGITLVTTPCVGSLIPQSTFVFFCFVYLALFFY